MTFLLAFERPFSAIVHRRKKCSRQKNPEGEDNYGNRSQEASMTPVEVGQ